jgi:hypothetical protein
VTVTEEIPGAPGADALETIEIDIDAELELVAFVAVIVKVVAVIVSVGVPLIVPATVENVSPAGKDEEIAQELLATAPPELVGVMVEIALLTGKTKVEGEMLIFGAARDGEEAAVIVRSAEIKVIE